VLDLQRNPRTTSVKGHPPAETKSGQPQYAVADHVADITSTITATLWLDAQGRLARAVLLETSPATDGHPATSTYSLDYIYGPVSVTLPPAGQAVTQAAFDLATSSLTLPTQVLQEAKGIAADATTRARSARRSSVRTSDLRAAAAQQRTQDANSPQLIPSTIGFTPAGVVVSAKNPFTHKRSSCAVLITAGKTAVRNG